MKLFKSLFLGAALAACGGAVVADQASDEAAIRKMLAPIPLDSVRVSPVPGIYEVASGSQVVYMSADGRYMFQGELVDMQTRQNLTEPTRRKAILKAIEGIDEKQMVIYEPEKTRHTITVLTDIDCGYCRKLHNEIDEFMDAGIRVRYMMYPRAGKGSDAYNKAVAVFCSDDPNQALTDAKNGKRIEMRTCDNPVDSQMALVEQVGARGTPFIIFENGQVQPGYAPAKEMARVLDQGLVHQR